MTNDTPNVGIRTELDERFDPNPRPTTSALRDYHDLVAEVATADDRRSSKSRTEIIAILNAAGKSPARFAEDVDHSRPRNRR